MTLIANKNALAGTHPILLLEFQYEPGSYYRFARWPDQVTFQGVTWDPFPISAAVELTESTTGEIPAYDIVVSNASQQMQSIFEYYVVEGTSGRLIWVYPDDISDPTQARIEPFTVHRATTNNQTATITVSSLPFDIMSMEFPTEDATQEEFPGLFGMRGERYTP